MLPEPIVALTAALAKLPGIGPRSAERMALHLVQTEAAAGAATGGRHAGRARTHPLLRRLRRAHGEIAVRHLRRFAAGRSLVCVVEKAVDILSIEKSGTFRGKFHVLGGKISPLDGVEPDDLRIARTGTAAGQRTHPRTHHRPGHGCGGRRHQPLSGQAARARRPEDFAHRLRPARRQRTGICR